MWYNINYFFDEQWNHDLLLKGNFFDISSYKFFLNVSRSNQISFLICYNKSCFNLIMISLLISLLLLLIWMVLPSVKHFFDIYIILFFFIYYGVSFNRWSFFGGFCFF